jgi:phospho-acceptor domain-containing protein
MRGSVSTDIFVVDSARSAGKPPRSPAKPKSRDQGSKAGPRSGKIAPLEISPPGPHPTVPEHDDREATSPPAGGNLAHEFNNLFTVILGHTEFLLKRDESKESSRLRVAEIRSAAERGALLTKHLLAFTRGQSPSPRGVTSEPHRKTERRQD